MRPSCQLFCCPLAAEIKPKIGFALQQGKPANHWGANPIFGSTSAVSVPGVTGAISPSVQGSNSLYAPMKHNFTSRGCASWPPIACCTAPAQYSLNKKPTTLDCQVQQGLSAVVKAEQVLCMGKQSRQSQLSPMHCDCQCCKCILCLCLPWNQYKGVSVACRSSSDSQLLSQVAPLTGLSLGAHHWLCWIGLNVRLTLSLLSILLTSW